MREWWANDFKVGPNYSQPTADVANDWIDAGQSRLIRNGTEDVRWWTAFGDSTLDRLIVAASQQNITLRIAGARILEARAQCGIAEGNLFPQQQEATGGYSRSAMSANTYPFNTLSAFGLVLPTYTYDQTQVGFDAAWELDFWGRFRRAIEAADAHLDAQVAGYDDVLVMLQAELAASYIQMRAFEERLLLARKNVELQTQTLKLATLRYNGGLVSELDVQQATSNLAVTESLIPNLETGHRRMQNRVCVLLGQPPYALDQMVNSPGTIPVPPPQVIVGIPADLLCRRPDIRRAERMAAVQSAQIGIAESEFYPHIAITGSIGVQAEQLNQLFTPQSLAGSIGPGFRWNILNYGRITNNVRAENAKFQQALLAYCDTVLRADEEVENGIVGYLREQDRVKSLEKSARAAARAVEIAMLQYEKGVIYYQPLLDSQRVLVQQQDAMAESRGLVAIDLVAIYKALGGGWQARLAENQPAANQAAAP